MNYKTHRKELLKDKAVRIAHESMLPEYELARSIINQRLKKKMTQQDVAEKTGMPQPTIARIEGLTHGLPRLATLKKIAKALDAELIITLKAKRTV
jgi:transcriptional regulator with XRE-family HTH domain